MSVCFERRWFAGQVEDTSVDPKSLTRKNFNPDAQLLYDNEWYDVKTIEVPAGVKCFFEDGSKIVLDKVSKINYAVNKMAVK